jgi:hypothetical protein
MPEGWQPAGGSSSGPAQASGLVGSPGHMQKLLGHWLLFEHGMPLPEQRLPPQMVAPTATQSAFDVHGVAAASLHVSQKHFPPRLPVPLQFGLWGVSGMVWVPVDNWTARDRNRASVPWLEGQSKLVSPKPGLVAST